MFLYPILLSTPSVKPPEAPEQTILIYKKMRTESSRVKSVDPSESVFNGPMGRALEWSAVSSPVDAKGVKKVIPAGAVVSVQVGAAVVVSMVFIPYVTVIFALRELRCSDTIRESVSSAVA